MSKFIEFMEIVNLSAVQYANEMEKIIFQDPSSAIVKARKCAEVIIDEVLKKEKIDEPNISTFYEKVSYLTREGYIKREIQKSFDTIRIKGNKQAHPGEQSDLSDAYKLHKELYNITIWFYEVYSVQQLKVPSYENPQPPKQENMEELIQKKLQEFLNKGKVDNQHKDNSNEQTVSTIKKQEEKHNAITLQENLKDGESYLLREINRLKDSSQEAIENANQFSHFKDYLHVDRKVQLDLERILEGNINNKQKNLVLLCGNVGDGKSHLLAYLKKNKPSIIENYTIFNDATESFSPNKDSMETLAEILRSFSDQRIEEDSKENIILAINMGVLHNFITTEHDEFTYSQLKEFVNESQLFTSTITTHHSSNQFDLLSFGDYHSYELTRNGPTSIFYTTLLKKITDQSEENPFFLAFKKDKQNGVYTMVHENFKLLQNSEVQIRLVQLIIQSIVKKKLVISARSFLNFIADIIIPDKVSNLDLLSEFEVLECSLPNLLFNRTERSDILNTLSELEPLHYRSEYIDQLVIDLNTLSNWDLIIEKNIKDETTVKWLEPFISKDSLMGYSFNLFFESFIRMTYLTNGDFAKNIADKTYLDYLKNLYFFNKGEMQQIKGFYEEIKSAIFKWKGSPKRDYIYLNKPNEKFRLAQKINLKPSTHHLNNSTAEELDSFKSTIVVAYHEGANTKTLFLEIDYSLYSLLKKVKEGYRPNKKDEEDAIRFVEFIDKLMAFGEKKNELLVFFKNDQRFYSIYKDDFGAFVFEKE